MATVLVVDDEHAVTEGVAALLRRQPYEVLRAHSADEAMTILRRCHVDVVISDEAMPGTSGSQLLHAVAMQYPTSARILLTGKASLEVALKAINGGKICRLLQKPCPPDELREAVAEAVKSSISSTAAARLLQVVRNDTTTPERGGTPSLPTPALRVHITRSFGTLDPAAIAALSPREREVFELIVDGQRLPQVAKALFISPHTARNHLKAIFEKLDVHSQEELVARSRSFAGNDRENDPR